MMHQRSDARPRAHPHRAVQEPERTDQKQGFRPFFVGWFNHFRNMPNAHKIKRYAKDSEKMPDIESRFGGVDHEIKPRFAQTESTFIEVE